MVDIREQSPLSLAFVGDAVYSLAIREYFVTSKRYNINTLNKMTVKYVSAHGQFMALELLADILTEEEQRGAKKTLIVLPAVDEKVVKSCANIPGVKTTVYNAINVYDILNCDKLVLAKGAAEKIQEVYVK